MAVRWIYEKPLWGDRVDYDAWGMPAPVGEWWLNDNAGNLATDSSGNNNHGTLTNGPVWTPTEQGMGLDFDGSNDYVVCNTPPPVAFTFIARLMARTTGSNPICFMGTSNGETNGVYLNYSSNRMLYYLGGSNFRYFNHSTDPDDAKWHVVAVAVPGTAQASIASSAAWVDGIPLTVNATTSSGGQETRTTFMMGCNTQSTPKAFNGQMAYALLFGEVLTTSQVQAVSQGPVPIWTPQRYWWVAGGGGGTTYTQECSETVTMTESRLNNTSRALSDTTALSDTLSKLLARTITDTLTETDSVSKDVARLLSDTTTPDDSLTKDTSRDVSETVTVTDAAVKQLERDLTDTVTLSDTLQKLFLRALEETVTATDTVTALKNVTTIYYQTLTDLVTCTDSVSRAQLLILAVTLARYILDAGLTRDVLDAALPRNVLDIDATRMH